MSGCGSTQGLGGLGASPEKCENPDCATPLQPSEARASYCGLSGGSGGRGEAAPRQARRRRRIFLGGGVCTGDVLGFLSEHAPTKPHSPASVQFQKEQSKRTNKIRGRERNREKRFDARSVVNDVNYSEYED